jgi:hypothetical protein
VPHGAARQAAIHRHYYEVFMPEERNDPLWDPDNEDQWKVFFTERRIQELAHYEGNGPPPAKKNTAPRKLWCGIQGHTLAWVLDHIAVGNYPRLTMPQRHWLPRRMDGPVSLSSRSSSSMPRTPRSGIVIGSPPSAPTCLLRPKKEPGSSGASSVWVKKETDTPASFTHVKKESGSFTRVKKEHDAPTPASSKKARRLTEDAARQLAYQALDDTEFPGKRAAERASFNEVQAGREEDRGRARAPPQPLHQPRGGR